jgi:predicted transcriptional regulator
MKNVFDPVILSNKEKAINIIKKLPNNFSLHQIAYQLEIEEQLEKSQQDSDAGRVLNSEEVKERLKDWLD